MPDFEKKIGDFVEGESFLTKNGLVYTLIKKYSLCICIQETSTRAIKWIPSDERVNHCLYKLLKILKEDRSSTFVLQHYSTLK